MLAGGHPAEVTTGPVLKCLRALSPRQLLISLAFGVASLAIERPIMVRAQSTRHQRARAEGARLKSCRIMVNTGEAARHLEGAAVRLGRCCCWGRRRAVGGGIYSRYSTPCFRVGRIFGPSTIQSIHKAAKTKGHHNQMSYDCLAGLAPPSLRSGSRPGTRHAAATLARRHRRVGGWVARCGTALWHTSNKTLPTLSLRDGSTTSIVAVII